ncbi:hypothetical protein ABTJ87_19905, partial [Acinetobacter baumannii]
MEREHLRDRLAVKIVHQSNLPDSNVGRYPRDLHNFFASEMCPFPPVVAATAREAISITLDSGAPSSEQRGNESITFRVSV